MCYWGDDRAHHDGKRPRGCLVLHKASVLERESARGGRYDGKARKEEGGKGRVSQRVAELGKTE